MAIKNNKVALVSDLAACKAAFAKVNIPWIIQGGIVLGYARHKDVMSWDTDLDLGVFIELTTKQRQTLFESLRSNGFRLGARKDFVCGARKISFNMFFFHKKGNFYEAFPSTMPKFKYIEKAEWHDEPQMVDFIGDKYLVPNHVEDWVDAHYGLDWKTNIIKDHSVYLKQKRGKKNDVTGWFKNRRRKDGNLWWPALLKTNENIKDLLP